MSPATRVFHKVLLRAVLAIVAGWQKWLDDTLDEDKQESSTSSKQH